MKKILFIAPIVILFILSCEEAEVTPIENNLEYFPNTTGTVWKYERYDSLQNTIDTFTVSIIGDTLISGDSCSIWVYDYKTDSEKFYVFQKDDSVKIFKPSINRIDQLYKIPFELKSGWVNPDYKVDTSFVSGFQDVMVNNKMYTNVVLIERKAFCCNDYLIEKIWIKPYVGLIKLERKHIIFGPYKNETWKRI
ncbi:MAG: hypothetical protein ABFS35_18705 [Bacteroidota bacterium]